MEHVWKFQEFCNSMTKLEIDSYEYAYLKALVLFSPGESALLNQLHSFLTFTQNHLEIHRCCSSEKVIVCVTHQIIRVWMAAGRLRNSRRRPWWSCRTMCRNPTQMTSTGSSVWAISTNFESDKLSKLVDLFWQVDPYPDPSPGPPPHELQHHGRALLHRFDRQRLHRQHHSLHTQDGDSWVQQPGLWPHWLTPRHSSSQNQQVQDWWVSFPLPSLDSHFSLLRLVC